MPLCSLWDLSSHPGIEPRPSAVRAPRPSHWTTRKSPCYQTYLRSSFYVLSKLLLFSHWVVSLWPYGLQHTNLSYPYLLPPRICSNSCPSSWWCHPTISSSIAPSPALNLSHHQGLFQGVCSSHQVAEVLELQPQHRSFQWIFRVDFL